MDSFQKKLQAAGENIKMDADLYTDDFEKASEYLRLALVLLSKNKIPPSPSNFRIGYETVAGKNNALKEKFSDIVAQENEVSADCLYRLYKNIFVQDESSLNAMRQEIKRIIANVQREFSQSGNKLSNYTDSLQQFSEILNTPNTPAVLSEEVDRVIEDTRTTEQSQQNLGRQFSHIMTEMASMRDELEQVRQESLLDGLTGIANRKAFDITLEKSINVTRERKASFTLLLIDIDYFKIFNDTHGHLVGDKVLRFVATTLKRNLKGGDMVARYGGEEFAVILPGTSLSAAGIVAEQIRQAVSSGRLKDHTNNESYGRVTVSVGITQFAMNDIAETIVRRADRALYLAKDRGRNRVEKAIENLQSSPVSS